MKNNSNIKWHQATVGRDLRQLQSGHKSVIIWFTGLSGSGKSTLAHAVEKALFDRSWRTFVFDGDNVRHGLCADLGFSPQDRQENFRRIGEMAKLFIEAGVIALTAFISPFKLDRDRVRGLVPTGDFIEVYCCPPLEICERRDVKGQYAKARQGIVKDFTGISSPYEVPVNPELVVDTGNLSLDQCVQQVMQYLADRTIIVK